MKEWHGWRLGLGAALHVGRLPGRKRVVLYREGNGVIEPLAYFVSEDEARWTLALLDRMIETLREAGE